MPTEKIKKVLKELQSLGILKIIFSHGESLLRNDFLGIVNFCNEIDLHVTLLSNGVLLNKDILKKLIDNGVSKILISLDSLEKDFHNKLRGLNNAWEGAIRGLDVCRKSGIKFGINTTINDSNFNRLDEFVDFAAKIGADEIDFLAVRPKTYKPYVVNKDWNKKYPNIIKKIWALKKQFEPGLIIGFHDPLAISVLKDDLNKKDLRKIIRENECQAGKMWVSIMPSGDVYPCNFLPINLGNILKNSFTEIWKNKDKFFNFKIPESCQNCELKNLCKGGCKAFPYSINKLSILGDPRCKLV